MLMTQRYVSALRSLSGIGVTAMANGRPAVAG